MRDRTTKRGLAAHAREPGMMDIATCPPASPLAFAPGTPETARDYLSHVHDYAQADCERELIAALASHPAMTGVWQALNLDNEAARKIISGILKIARRALIPTAKWQEVYGGCGLDEVVSLASQLREALWSTAKIIEPHWPEILPYDKFQDFLKEVEWIASVYRQIGDEREAYFSAIPYPHSGKSHGEPAAGIAFSRMVSDFFARECGAPFDDVVADLVLVMFGKSVSADTVRQRRGRRGWSS
jgi:hypothetical protein